MGAQQDKAASIFDAAVELGTPAERAAYLDAACGQDTRLRAEIEELLGHDDAAGSFLNLPARPDPQATADEASVSEGPGTVIGAYKLLEQIGEGGFGVVFMAEQTEPVRRKVALKVLKPGMDSRQVIARFEAERQALALMDHPNIAKVLEGGQTATGRPYFVMDLVKGVPITEFCDQSQLTPKERLELFIHVCQAVQHAHQKGIIHRDIKPSNVLVTLQDSAPLVKVIDFGIAKALGQQLTDKTLCTGFAQMIGTPLYMSPEQAVLSNVDVDTRSDIYSLGVLLYELLTGTTPFDKERFKEAGYDEIRRIIREEEPPRPSTRISTLGRAATTISTQRKSDPRRLSQLFRGELDWIVMKCLEKDRNRRYETASAFTADVRRYLHDEPVQACPPSAGYRFRKFVRRNKRTLATLSFLGLTLLTAVVALSVGLVVVNREKERTQAAAAEATAVRDFFEKQVLAAARPKDQDGGLGKDATIRAAVDAAEAKITDAFHDRPLVEAAIRNSLGTTYFHLSEFALAAQQYERAVSLRLAKLGLSHPDTLQSRFDLASALWVLPGRLHEAIALEEETLKLRKATLGPDHRDTLDSMGNLAEMYWRASKRQLAQALFEEALAKYEATLGPDHPDTLSSINRVASVYLDSGQPDKAIPLIEQTLAARKKKPGPDHPDMLGSMANLADAYRAADRLGEAIALYEQTLAKQKERLGPDHYNTLATTHNLASAYLAARRLDKALPLLEQVRARLMQKFGPDAMETLTCMDALAGAYRDAGQFDKALPLYEEALARQEKLLGPDHTNTLQCMNNLGWTYILAGQLDKALPLLEQALAGQQKSLGPDHPRTLTTLQNLASAYIAAKQPEKALPLLLSFLATEKKRYGAEEPRLAGIQANVARELLKCGQFADAEPILRECLAIREKKEPDAWPTFDTQSALGGALLGERKYAEAEPFLLKGYHGMKQREASIPSKDKARLREAVERLVRLYDAWSKKDEAAKWRKELEAHKKSK